MKGFHLVLLWLDLQKAMAHKGGVIFTPFTVSCPPPPPNPAATPPQPV